jgi:UDP-glucose 4-epimerase
MPILKTSATRISARFDARAGETGYRRAPGIRRAAAENDRDMKILITGGTGFIGLHTARAFLDAGHEVVATQFRVRRDPAFIANELGGRLQREIVDITSPYGVNDVVRKHRVDGIVHLAVPGVGASALSPSEDYRTNMQSLLNIFDAALSFGITRVIVASSVTVYEGQPAGPYHEALPLPVASTNSTAAYKKAWEILAYHYADRSQLEIVSARIGYIYGPLYHSMVNVLARIVHSAVRDTALVKPNEAFAGDSFDYCYVKDCARALMLLQTAPALAGRVYNVGAGRATSIGEILAATQTIAPALAIDLQPGARDAIHGPDNYMTIDAIARDTGYAPAYDIRSAIADYAAWLRENEF